MSETDHDPQKARAERIERAKARAKSGTRTPRKDSGNDPVMADPTYGELQQDERVVMRHQIALNLETFRASTEEFDPRPQGNFPPLQPAVVPFFSVILPNFNGMSHLPTVMEALDRQSFRDFEMIVVDDAGTDQSVVWLEEHYPQARLIVNRRNMGFAVSCNLGAAAARGRFLVFLNTDTEPDVSWLAETAQAICRHPDAAAFASKLLFFDRRDTVQSAGDFMASSGIPGHRGFGEPDDGRFEQEEEVFGACGGAAVIRGDVWEALGGFDESLWMYMEDVDFAFRSRLMGWKTIFVPRARVYHHMGATGGGPTASYYVGRNTIWVLAKNMPDGLALRFGAKIVAAQWREVTAAARAYRGEAARARLRGMLAGLLGLPAVLSRRRAVQSNRVLNNDELAALFHDA